MSVRRPKSCQSLDGSSNISLSLTPSDLKSLAFKGAAVFAVAVIEETFSEDWPFGGTGDFPLEAIVKGLSLVQGQEKRIQPMAMRDMDEAQLESGRAGEMRGRRKSKEEIRE